jgi:hypothetical protein
MIARDTSLAGGICKELVTLPSNRPPFEGKVDGWFNAVRPRIRAIVEDIE